MKLHIGRHGQASFDAPSDRDRPLTPAGQEATRELIRTNKSQFSGVKTIWSSDLLRARQTASIVAEELGLSVEQKSFLTPDSEPEEVIKGLDSMTDEVFIVSHQPLVGDFVSVLCTGNILESHPFTTSEVVTVDCEMIQSGLGQISGVYRP